MQDNHPKSDIVSFIAAGELQKKPLTNTSSNTLNFDQTEIQWQYQCVDEINRADEPFLEPFLEPFFPHLNESNRADEPHRREERSQSLHHLSESRSGSMEQFQNSHGGSDRHWTRAAFKRDYPNETAVW